VRYFDLTHREIIRLKHRLLYSFALHPYNSHRLETVQYSFRLTFCHCLPRDGHVGEVCGTCGSIHFSYIYMILTLHQSYLGHAQVGRDQDYRLRQCRYGYMAVHRHNQYKPIPSSGGFPRYESIHIHAQFYTYHYLTIVIGLPWTRAVDVFSFGCILVELVVGRPMFPYTGDSLERLSAMTYAIGPMPVNLAIQGHVTRGCLFADTDPPTLKALNAVMYQNTETFAAMRKRMSDVIPLKVCTFSIISSTILICTLRHTFRTIY
jgi:hypothetical protein